MSYHEIEVQQSFNLKCRHCVYEGWALTAALAQQNAIDHIEMESVNGGMPNYDHPVEISPVTRIGRSL